MMDFQPRRLNNRTAAADPEATYWEIARWVCVGAVFLALILTYAWLQTEILNVNYQMEQLKKDNNQLREMNTALRAEHSSLTNPEKIDRQARALGLISSNRAEVRILQTEPALLPPAENLVAESLHSKKTLNE